MLAIIVIYEVEYILIKVMHSLAPYKLHFYGTYTLVACKVLQYSIKIITFQLFCTFDDYNWDWSLQHISMTCIPQRLKVMVMKSPRIFHIGEW